MGKKEIHYKAIKCKLKSILRSTIDYTNFFQIIDTSNKIVTLCYIFMRSYILYCYDSDLPLPILDKKFVKDSIMLLTESITGCGPKPNIDVTLKYFYKNYFIKNISKNDKIMTSNMVYIIEEICLSIVTSMENIIIDNYDRCLNKYICIYVNDFYKNEKLSKKDKRKIIIEIKNVLIGITNIEKCNNDHIEWVKKEQTNIISETMSANGYNKDLKHNVSNYVKPMIYMNKEFEKLSIQLTQFMPLRNTIYPKYITLNTSALIDIFVPKNKAYYFKNTFKLKHELWNKYFNLKRLKLKGYEFACSLETDGFATSVMFIDCKDVHKLNNKIKCMRDKRILSKKEDYVKKTHTEKVHIRIDKDSSIEEYKKEMKKKFKALPKETQNEIIFKKKLEEKFPHIETLVKNKATYEMIKNYQNKGKLIVADPGKRSELYMMGIRSESEKNQVKGHKRENKFSQYKFLNLTTKQRLLETRRIKYQNTINTRKFKHKIDNKRVKEYENELVNYNSKTCELNKFWDYSNKKLEINSKLADEYNDAFYRKLKWYGYINSRRYDDKMLNIIEKTYGRDILIILGDWSMKGKLKFISTPNMRIKKKLSERFKVILIDEFNTSKYHYKSNVKCEHMKCERYKKTKAEKSKEIKIIHDELNKDILMKYVDRGILMKRIKEAIKEMHNKPIMMKLHSVLTYKTENVMGCINRDRNAVLNMWRIVDELVRTKKRPQLFQRSQCTVAAN